MQHQTLARGFSQCSDCPITVSHAAMTVPEIKFCEVLIDVLNVVKCADEAALEQRKISFNRVRMGIAANVLTRTVVHGLMRRKTLPRPAISRIVIGDEMRRWIKMLIKHLFQILSAHLSDTARTDAPAAFDQGDNRNLLCAPSAFVWTGTLARLAAEGPLKVPMRFDEAIKRALTVKPPEEGWKEYERKLKRQQRRRRSKTAA
jgi:hypothetical protein